MNEQLPGIDSPKAEYRPLSFINRLIGVWLSPAETFPDMKSHPGIAVPLIVSIIFIAITSAMTVSRLPMEKAMTQPIDQMVEEGRLTAEQAEQQREQVRKIAPYARVATPVMAALYAVLLPLIIAAVALLATMMMGIESRFTALWSVAIYVVLATTVVSTVLFAVILFTKSADEIDMTNPLGSNLAALLAMAGVTALPRFVRLLLTYFDVFYIWKTVLFGIGFAAVTARLKTSTSIIVCSVVAFLVAIVAAGVSALFS